jgi:hypothetical protein
MDSKVAAPFNIQTYESTVIIKIATFVIFTNLQISNIHEYERREFWNAACVYICLSV